MSVVFDDDDIINCNCVYHELSSLPNNMHDSILHLNIRSIAHKVEDLEALLTILKTPIILALTETWMHNDDCSFINIPNYTFISSPRIIGQGGGVGIFINDCINYKTKIRSSDCKVTNSSNIDYILLELPDLKIGLCCLYCPPKSKLHEIIFILDYIKTCCKNLNLIVVGDFNINLLDKKNDIPLEFINNLHTLGLHLVITLPTRVTNSTSTLIDNIMCDYSMLPTKASVGKTDISDHYLTVLHLNSVVWCL
jgi:hypothetical protein